MLTNKKEALQFISVLLFGIAGWYNYEASFSAIELLYAMDDHVD